MPHPDLRVVTARSEAYRRAIRTGLSQADAREYAEAETARVACEIEERRTGARHGSLLARVPEKYREDAWDEARFFAADPNNVTAAEVEKVVRRATEATS